MMTRKITILSIALLLMCSTRTVAQILWAVDLLVTGGEYVFDEYVWQNPHVLKLEHGLYIKNVENNSRTEDNQEYALEVEGAVYIGNGYQFDDDEEEGTGRLNLAHREWLKSRKLFVEDGIVTEALTYIYKEDWDEWPDYVFEEEYNLLSLPELKTYIRENKHLPGIPSQSDVKRYGVSDKEMTKRLLERIEELTLYTIQQHKSIANKKAVYEELDKRRTKLANVISSLENDN